MSKKPAGKIKLVPVKPKKPLEEQKRTAGNLKIKMEDIGFIPK